MAATTRDGDAAATAAAATAAADDDDAWTRRIKATGCADENTAVLLCYADTRDWRRCAPAVRAFRDCFERHRTQALPVTPEAPAAQGARVER